MPTTDRAHDVLGAGRMPLEAFFAPRSVALVGATEKEGSVGRTIMWNLIRNAFGGVVYPVNPKRPAVLGVKAYPRVADVPERPDLAVVVTPAASVPGVIGECAAAGVKAAIVISAGFRETGPAGAELERRTLEIARGAGMRLIGPNCLGVMSPVTGLNATFAAAMARPGSVGFISQSGALCTAILDWSLRENVGFSAFVSVGSMLDVGWGDLIDHLGDDPRTRSILLYMESIGDARAFLSAAREVALTKPIIAIKAGRTAAAAKAAASHTGALAGSDEVLDAAFRRCGVLRVDSISELFHMAEVLSMQPRPAGPRLAVVTNAGGPGVLAADALVSEGGRLSGPAPETLAALDGVLPPHWSHNNPVDVLGDADAARYAQAVGIVARDPGSDGLLVILTPQAMTDPTATAEKLKPFARIEGKPVLASWMGGSDVAAGEAILTRAGIPTFRYPDTAARVFCHMSRHAESLRALYETPAPEAGEGAEDRARAAAVVAAARAAGRALLTEAESKGLLAAWGLPVVETRVAATEDEAVAHADALGYPVVLKLHSLTLTHKTDVGGVQLDLAGPDAVRRAWRAVAAAVREKAGAEHFQGAAVQPMVRRAGYELIVGSTLDAQFGPVLLFGAGGQLVEVYRDRALGLPPLTTTLARRLMEQTRVFAALRGVRGRKPVDLDALDRFLVRFSRLVVEVPGIREVDVNPLLASPEGLVALDARVVLHGRDVADDRLPRPAIRPYPSHLVSPWRMRDGTEALIRPIRPEDEPLMVRFHGMLSDRSVYSRYFHPMQLSERVTHHRLTRICFNDYDREMALVAEVRGPVGGAPEIVGVGRLSRAHGVPEAEFALLIADRCQRQGLGTELLRRLVAIGRDERLQRITADILADNTDMQRVGEKLGFRIEREPGEGVVRAVIDL